MKTNHFVMNKVLLMLLLTVFATVLISCRENPKPKQAVSGDAAFRELTEEFLEGYLSWRPQYAVYLGLHEYDS